MKTRLLPAICIIAICFVLDTPLFAADVPIRFGSQPGSKVRLEGTSSVHDWQVEGKLIGGFLEVGAGFPVAPGQAVSPGKVDARAEAFIPVRSLKSIEKDGRPYSDSMDDIMHGKLLGTENPRILYHLDELTLTGSPKSPDAPYIFDSKGDLVVAGITNRISMPINVTPLGDKKLKISGNTAVKMTDFGIKPPAPALGLGLIKTGDEVKLRFEWLVEQKAAGGAK